MNDILIQLDRIQGRMNFHLKSLSAWPDVGRILWDWFLRGPTICVGWPTGEIRIRQEESNSWDYVRSADPNDHYRPWLEEHVGKQGWDWNWDVSGELLAISFRKGKAMWATEAALRWAM